MFYAKTRFFAFILAIDSTYLYGIPPVLLLLAHIRPTSYPIVLVSSLIACPSTAVLLQNLVLKLPSIFPPEQS